MEEERKMRFDEPGGEYVPKQIPTEAAGSQHKSLIQMLLTYGIVQTQKQAEQVLIVATACFIMLTLWIWSFGGAGDGVDTSGVDDPRDAIQI